MTAVEASAKNPICLDHSQGGMTPRQQALHGSSTHTVLVTDAEIHQVVHTLAAALGAIRTEAGSIKALHAVLMAGAAWDERRGSSTPPRVPR